MPGDSTPRSDCAACAVGEADSGAAPMDSESAPVAIEGDAPPAKDEDSEPMGSRGFLSVFCGRELRNSAIENRRAPALLLRA